MPTPTTNNTQNSQPRPPEGASSAQPSATPPPPPSGPVSGPLTTSTSGPNGMGVQTQVPGDGDNAGEFEQGNRARRSKKELDEDPDYRIKLTGRMIGRLIEAWRDLRKIINDGFAWNRELHPDHYSSLEQLHHELYEKIMIVLPTLPDDIRARGNHGTARVADLLDKGRRAARNEDTNHIKTRIANWQDFNPPIVRKSARGFRHVECARLLRPCGLDFDDPIARERLLNLDPRYLPSPTHFPAFLWPNGEPSQSDFYGGFMRGELIEKAIILMLYGPSAAERDDGTPQGRTKCIAEIYGIEAITPELLAYAAMEVRFALDSQPYFGAGDSKKSTANWPLREFYYHLISYIKHDMPTIAYRRLMDWWQRRIFGDVSYDDFGYGNRSSVADHAIPATAQLMQAQAARLAEQDDTQTGSGPTTPRSSTEE